MHAFLISFFTIASLHFLGLVSPGPDFALVTRNALLYPRRESVYTALGIALGIAVHVSYCIFGIALITSHSLLFFTFLKYSGGAYLIYMGIKSWVSPTQTSDTDSALIEKKAHISVLTAIRQGFLCNVLNPKAGLSIIVLFTLVVKYTTPLWQQLVYGAWMVSITFAWFSCISVFITHPNIRYKLQRIQPGIVKFLGVLLFIMGVCLLFFSWENQLR